jgi:tungstate transport system permease protein
MNDLNQGFAEAWRMIVALDPDVVSAVRVSLSVSLWATLLAGLAGVPAGFILGLKTFAGRNIISAVLHTLTGIPTVVVGLVGYMMLTAHGPLGSFQLLYTQAGIVLGLFLLLLPLMTVLCMSATASIHAGVFETALTLGATPVRAAAAVVREGRFAYLTAVTTGFGRAIGEVGVAMMLGGNIRGFTRTMTTALALETDKGKFGLALALGLVLLIIALCVNASLHYLKSRAEKD